MVAYKSFCKSLTIKHLRGAPAQVVDYQHFADVNNNRRAKPIQTAHYQPRVFSRGWKPVFSLTLTASPQTSQV